MSALVLMAGAPAARAGVNVWTSNGPGVVGIHALAVDPITPSTLYSGTDSQGIFKSTDGAATWQLATSGSPGDTFVFGFVIDPTAPSTVYATTVDGVAKSTDGAASWRWANSGLGGSIIGALAIDPTTSSTLYAGTYSGVFKSTDGAAHWQPASTGLPENEDNDVADLAVDPRTPSTVYARIYSTNGATGTSSASVFKSTDGAATWQPATSGLPAGDHGMLVIDPATPSTLYAGIHYLTDGTGTDSAGVFKSTDGAATWQPASSGLPGAASVRALAIDPATPSTLYAGTDGGFFKSTDGAASWQRATTGLGEESLIVSELAIDPSTPSTLYAAGTYDAPYIGTSGGIFKTMDRASSWQPASSGLAGGTVVDTLAVDPGSPSVLYAGTADQGAFKSSDHAASWHPATSALAGFIFVEALAIDPTTPSTLYATGTYHPSYIGTSGGIFKSTDGAFTWQPANSGLPGGFSVHALAIDPTTSSTLYAGTYSAGVFKSTDGAASWQPTTSGLPDGTGVRVLAIDPTGPATLCAGTAVGVFKSTDGAASWQLPPPGLSGRRIDALAIDPATPSTLYAGTFGGVFKSTDGAASWQRATSALGGFEIRALAIDPATPSTLYAGTFELGVLKSTDGTASWQPANGGLPGGFSVHALAIDPAAPSTLYAGASSQYSGIGGVFKSTDGALTWRLASVHLVPNVAAFAIDPTTPSTLYAVDRGLSGDRSFVVKSTDGAATWQRASTGFPEDTFVYTLVIDPATPSTLYAGAGGGVFKSTDGAASWEPATAGLPGDTSAGALAIDPSAPSTLYAGAGGGYAGAGGRVFKSTDGAALWKPASAGLPDDTDVVALAIDPTTPSTLYAATSTYNGEHGTFSAGVFKSTDGAASWQPINAGLPVNVHVTTLAIDPTTPSTLYAGTWGLGVFSMQQVAVCVGDCGGDHTVTVDELLTLVNIAQETQPVSACPAGVAPGTTVDVALIIQAVNYALSGCSDG